MSGVEIAGLALAVLPILIAAAEHAKSKGLDPRRADFMENLAFEVTLLHMSLTRLAKGLSELPNELREKLSSQQAAQDLEANWKSIEVVYALKMRLGSGYETFVVTLRAILDCLERLLEKKSLGLSNDETILSQHTYAKLNAIRDKTNSTPINTLSHRVRYSLLEAKKYGQILTKIKEKNEQLEKIVLWSSDTLFALQESPKESRIIGSPHIQLRPLMHTLYKTLGGLWPCDCHRKHEARLCLLQHRDQRRDSVTADTGEGDNVYFNMLMSLSSGENGQYCRWLEMQLCIALQQDTTPQSTRGVRFDLHETSSPVDSGTGIDMVTISPGVSGTPISGRRASTAVRRKIEKICHTLLQADRNLCSPQILFDEGCLWHVTSKQSARRSSRTLSVKGNEVDTSLASLLRGERRFRPKEKRILSVILANSLLHFCESPWLSTEWNKEHISFFSSSMKGDLDIRRPYLSTNFQNMIPEDEDDALFRIHPNPSVLALGILLLEIELNLPIEGERDVEDHDEDGNPNVNTDYFAALRLFESNKSDDIYRNHRQAVHACLNCNFYNEETMEPSLDDPEFRQAVYENIVRPLEQELHTAYELTPDDLGLDLI